MNWGWGIPNGISSGFPFRLGLEMGTSFEPHTASVARCSFPGRAFPRNVNQKPAVPGGLSLYHQPHQSRAEAFWNSSPGPKF